MKQKQKRFEGEGEAQNSDRRTGERRYSMGICATKKGRVQSGTKIGREIGGGRRNNEKGSRFLCAMFNPGERTTSREEEIRGEKGNTRGRKVTKGAVGKESFSSSPYTGGYARGGTRANDGCRKGGPAGGPPEGLGCCQKKNLIEEDFDHESGGEKKRRDETRKERSRHSAAQTLSTRAVRQACRWRKGTYPVLRKAD